MAKQKNNKTTHKYEEAVKKSAEEKYILRLFVTGTTPRSLQAIEAIKKICEENLQGRYNLEIIDIYQQPKLAEGDQIIAVPTLLKVLPSPLRRFIGDLSDSDKILLGLDLKKR
jgi:circadian clock protein KaiB